MLNAAVIDFEDRVGPSMFMFAGPAQTLTYTVGGTTVTFEGGVVLTHTTNLPANQTSVYGTADFGDPSLMNPLTVTFSSPITNFFLDVYNGKTINVEYTVADNTGHSAAFTLIPNLSGGKSQIGFAATGTQVTITSNTSGFWDFFIDNVHFDEPLPPDLGGVPEPGTFLMLGGGLAAVGAGLRLRK